MKREERFVGHGNVWMANSQYRGWQVTCAKCGINKTVSSLTRGASLPPEVVVKKFVQAGWEIGLKSIDDRCPGCQRRRRPAPIVNGHTAPVQQFVAEPAQPQWHDAEEYFSRLRLCAHEVLAAANAKQHNKAARSAAELIMMLKRETTSTVIAAITPAPPIAPVAPAKPGKPAPAPDPDYDKWLADLVKEHDQVQG